MQTELEESPLTLLDEEQFQYEKRLAIESFSKGKRDEAWQQLKNFVHWLSPQCGSYKTDSMFVSASIELSNISFIIGRGFNELIDILLKALKAAGRIGDRRSRAMINLHLARLLYFAKQREQAMSLFLTGKIEVEALGDEDIHNQASEFIGLFYFFQGRFREAIRYFESAAESFEYDKELNFMNPSGPLWLSYCLSFLGQFHRAIGTIDYYRRLAEEHNIESIGGTLRAALGIILLAINKKTEAYYHLSGALKQSQRNQNALAIYFATGGIALHHYKEGRFEQAASWLEKTMVEGEGYGLVHQYASPLILEILFGLHQKGFLSDATFNYEQQFKRIMREPNIHLRGVALRLNAQNAFAKKEPPLEDIEATLLESEAYLKNTGAVIELGKTRLDLAHLKLLIGDKKNAYLFAQKARKDFGSYVNIFFPDELRPLINLTYDTSLEPDNKHEMLDIFADVIQEFSPSPGFDRLLSRIVMATNRFFGAERGGIFWFGPGEFSDNCPILRGSYNLLNAEINSEEFKYSLTLIFQSFNEKSPKILCCNSDQTEIKKVKAMLCVPFSFENQIRGVLYHDNCYLTDCFDNFDIEKLSELSQWLTSYINNFSDFTKKINKEKEEGQKQANLSYKSNIPTQSPKMISLIDQIDNIAQSNSSVLITGETGVGKELVARRIHELSIRADQSYVIVDLSSIPENLVESELFGFEKGAFTGADRQKIGKIEIAHKGTLFIDEIGEIPKSIQVKLLRTIQEKTFHRIGGVKVLRSDFRLITATNRDLSEEVEAGRFREDLFYRLNVIPFEIPPLRERPEDIIFLSQHFISHFSNKYSKKGLKLTQAQQDRLCEHDWPGNIRELKNTIERAVLLSQKGNLNISMLSKKRLLQEEEDQDMPTLDEVQRRYICRVLSYTNGKISGPDGAAKILGINRTTLFNRMKKLGIK
jgi:transcriptional regulator with GAF, ATPase, and Fis domain